MSNLDIWNKLGKTDPAHTKSFNRAGGFKGTAIKPIYTEQKMTEQFGVCGVGWGIDEPKFQVVPGNDGQMAVYCWVSIWIKDGDTVSAPIHGVGGDMVVVKQSAGLRTDDEAFKKAFTDAVGNAMKHLGMSADVHMGRFDDDKYVSGRRGEEAAAAAPAGPSLAFQSHAASIRGAKDIDTLKMVFVAAMADGAISKGEAETLVTLKDQRKADLTPSAKNLGDYLDRLQAEAPANG